jgi:hypothetical protein
MCYNLTNRYASIGNTYRKEDFKMEEISFVDKYLAAKSFTELAIQNKLIDVYTDSDKTAKNIASFFNTIMNEIK